VVQIVIGRNTGLVNLSIMNRKEFFNTAGRLLILGGITASAGYLVLNNKVSASCSVAPTCNSCGKFAKCELPQAKKILNSEIEINR